MSAGTTRMIELNLLPINTAMSTPSMKPAPGSDRGLRAKTFKIHANASTIPDSLYANEPTTIIHGVDSMAHSATIRATRSFTPHVVEKRAAQSANTNAATSNMLACNIWHATAPARASLAKLIT